MTKMAPSSASPRLVGSPNSYRRKIKGGLKTRGERGSSCGSAPAALRSAARRSSSRCAALAAAELLVMAIEGFFVAGRFHNNSNSNLVQRSAVRRSERGSREYELSRNLKASGQLITHSLRLSYTRMLHGEHHAKTKRPALY